MGKGILLTVVTTLVCGGVLFFNIQRSALEVDQRGVGYQEQILAREIARTGSNYAVSRVRNDPFWKAGFDEIPHMGGSFVAEITRPQPGLVFVVSTGTYADQTHRVETAISLDIPIQGALTLDSRNDVKMDMSGNSRIIGNDTDLDGSQGPSHSIHGIYSNDQDVAAQVLSQISAGQVYGAGGQKDVASGYLRMDIDALYQEALLNADFIIDDEKKLRDVYGSREEPVIVIVHGDKVDLTKNMRGYGILILTGDRFKMDKDVFWEGIIMLYGDDETKFEIKGNSYVQGAFIVHNRTSVDSHVLEGHMDIDVFDGAKKRRLHVHNFDRKFDVTYVNITHDPKLLYDPLVGYEPRDVRITFMNKENSGGQYKLVVGNTTYTGNNLNGIDVVVNAADIKEFVVDFGSRDGLKKSGPGDVQKDNENRNGAFSVQMFDAVSSSMIYELSAYNHADLGKELKPEKNRKVAKKKQKGFELKMGGNSRVVYSTEAIWMVAQRFESLKSLISVELIDQWEN